MLDQSALADPRGRRSDRRLRRRAPEGGWFARRRQGRLDLLATRGVTLEEDTPLTLGAELRAYSLTSGGSLSITAGSVCIADEECETTGEDALLLKPADLIKGRLRQLRDSQQRAISKSPPTRRSISEQLNSSCCPMRSVASGAKMSSLARIVRLPDHLRAATNLTLGASIVHTPAFERYSDLIIGTGSVLQLDRPRKVSLLSNSRVLIDGTIDARGRLDLRADRSHALRRRISRRSGCVARLEGESERCRHAVPASHGCARSARRRCACRRHGVDRGPPRLHRHALDSVIDGSAPMPDVDILHPDGNGHTPRTCTRRRARCLLTSAEGMLLNGEFRAQGGATNAAGGTLKITVDATQREDTPQPSPLFSAFSGPRSILVTADDSANSARAGRPICRASFRARPSSRRTRSTTVRSTTSRCSHAISDRLGSADPPALGEIHFEGGANAEHPRAEPDARRADPRHPLRPVR